MLDPAALERLDFVARAGDPTLVARLVGLFLEDTPARLHGLRAAFDGRDDSALRAIAHGLRGSAETFGAHEMVSHSYFLEYMPSEWDVTAVQAHVEALFEAFNRTRAALEVLVARGSA